MHAEHISQKLIANSYESNCQMIRNTVNTIKSALHSWHYWIMIFEIQRATKWAQNWGIVIETKTILQSFMLTRHGFSHTDECSFDSVAFLLQFLDFFCRLRSLHHLINSWSLIRPGVKASTTLSQHSTVYKQHTQAISITQMICVGERWEHVQL